MNWNDLLHMITEGSKEKKYEDIRADFNFHDFRYAALGDVTISYDAIQDKFDVEIKMYEIHVLNDDGSFGGQMDHPMPEMIRDARNALQDKANEIAAERGDFDGVRSSPYPTFRDPDEPEPRD